MYSNNRVNPSRRQAVIYCRVSTNRQVVEGDGLNSQETRCREFARMKGHEVIEVFRDDVSGKFSNRPGMKAMLAFLRKHRTRGLVVIIDDVSRLARGLSAHLELRASIASAGGLLESPSIEFGEDSDSLLVENLLASVSQHQRQKNGEQAKNRMRARMMNGYWVHQAPMGYRYQRIAGRGAMLRREEPLASVVQEALEGFASGRFESQAEVLRFLQASPVFPKDSRGIVRHQRVGDMLAQPVYAGYLESKVWDISLRPAQHEGLISFETFQRIRDRLSGGVYAPRRKNLNEDFPLRGFVICDDCGTPLTACWSKGSHSHHPYYLCPKRGCASYGKSIRRDRIEGEFETLLQDVAPSETLFRIARRMFADLWAHRAQQAETQAKAMTAQLAKVEKQVAQLLERILDASLPSVISAYEEKISRLEEEKLLIREKMASARRPASSFDKTLRTALDFLANPWKLWKSERLEDKQTVLKLAFADRLRYTRKSGFRTADLSMPFKILTQVSGARSLMADRGGFEPPIRD